MAGRTTGMAKSEAVATESIDGKAERDAPLIDLNGTAIKKLIARAKKRGVITYDELNEALPQDQMSSEQIEDVMSALSDMGVNIVENDAREGDGQESAEGEEEETSLDEAEAAPTLDRKRTPSEIQSLLRNSK